MTAGRWFAPVLLDTYGRVPVIRVLTLTSVAGLAQLEHLEIKAPLPDERLPLLKDFAFLKSMRLVPAKDPYTTEAQAKIKALLPKTEIQFK